ncbi:MAG TPA: hypothetical protein VL093_03050 [Flavipsychrobacter sp.]|nr:hypothetical protein [Flavipsychrobacter sp.]
MDLVTTTMDLLSPTIFSEVANKGVKSTQIGLKVTPTGEEDFPIGIKSMSYRGTKMPEGNKMMRWQLLPPRWT